MFYFQLNLPSKFFYKILVPFLRHGFGTLTSITSFCTLPSPPTPRSQLISYLSNCLFFLAVDSPKITQHPESKSVVTGASTTITVEASGDGLQFQWKKDGKDLHDCSKYCGTKTHTLNIKDVEKSDKGSYQCLVKSDGGEELSEEADLTVSKLVRNVIDSLILRIFFCEYYVWFNGLVYTAVTFRMFTNFISPHKRNFLMNSLLLLHLLQVTTGHNSSVYLL